MFNGPLIPSYWHDSWIKFFPAHKKIQDQIQIQKWSWEKKWWWDGTWNMEPQSNPTQSTFSFQYDNQFTITKKLKARLRHIFTYTMLIFVWSCSCNATFGWRNERRAFINQKLNRGILLNTYLYIIKTYMTVLPSVFLWSEYLHS